MCSLRANSQRGRTPFLSRKFRAFQRPGILFRTPETLQRLPGDTLATGRARFVSVVLHNTQQDRLRLHMSEQPSFDIVQKEQLRLSDVLTSIEETARQNRAKIAHHHAYPCLQAAGYRALAGACRRVCVRLGDARDYFSVEVNCNGCITEKIRNPGYAHVHLLPRNPPLPAVALA